MFKLIRQWSEWHHYFARYFCSGYVFVLLFDLVFRVSSVISSFSSSYLILCSLNKGRRWRSEWLCHPRFTLLLSSIAIVFCWHMMFYHLIIPLIIVVHFIIVGCNNSIGWCRSRLMEIFLMGTCLMDMCDDCHYSSLYDDDPNNCINLLSGYASCHGHAIVCLFFHMFII